ncbi:histidyl-tRNA synthetase [mine drainage metagenome]|uniref:Histidyl-tRNA synthetase n=1 Tax=mine drainage metagenome TaxID=410659 RepID=T1C6T6_9ZZZZ
MRTPSSADVYIVVSGPHASGFSLGLIERLRDELPGRRFELNLGGGALKTQFRRADRSGAALAVILGDDELQRGVAALKPLRREAGQSESPLSALAAAIESALAVAAAQT